MVKQVSMKQWVEPESTRALKGWSEILSELSGIMRELDERADALSLTSLVARRGSTQSSTCAEGGLLSIFWVHSRSGVRLLVGLGGSGLGLQGRGHGFPAVMGYMTAFAAKEAKFVVHSSLSLLLG